MTDDNKTGLDADQERDELKKMIPEIDKKTQDLIDRILPSHFIRDDGQQKK